MRNLILKFAATMWLLIGSQVVCFGQAAGADEVQTWLDETLKHKIEAKFKGMEGEFVKLETADGTVKKIPYAKLSLSSQLKAKKMSDPKSFDAPPLPSAYSAPPVPDSAFSADDTIEQYLEKYFSQLKAGHAEVVWHSLPPAAQADLEAAIVRLAEILGPNTFKQMQAVLPNLHVIVRDKRSMIINSQTFQSQPQMAKLASQALPAMEPLVGVLTKPATWNGENFKQGKVGPWIMLFANETLAATKTLVTFLKPLLPANAGELDINNLSYKVLEKSADLAKVEITNAATKQVIGYKKVDGLWINDEIKSAADSIAGFKNYLENLDQAGRDLIKQRTRDGLIGANTVLGSLAKAKTQQEFNLFFDPLASEFMRGFQQSMARQNQGMPGMGTPGMGNPGYGAPTPGMGTPGMNMSSGGMP